MTRFDFQGLRIVGLALLVAGPFRANATSAQEPATKPVDVTTQLIEQLGDTDAAVRRSAAWRLREIGAPALPALRKAAMDSNNSEVQAAASAAIKALDHPPLPEVGAGPRTTKLLRGDRNSYLVEIHDGQRLVRIEGGVVRGPIDSRSVKVTFSGTVDGKETTQTFSAENAEQLKWEAPEAWAYYQSVFSHEAEMASVHVAHTRLNSAVRTAMDAQNFSDAQRKEVEDRLAHYCDVSSKALASLMLEPATAPQRMGERLRESDAVRKFLTDRHLPIIEGAQDMDPPPTSRLGLGGAKDKSVGGQSGLWVQVVATGDRADRIGVRAGDIIQKIDGVPVDSVNQFRPLCEARTSGMTIELTRNGKTITLQEK